MPISGSPGDDLSIWIYTPDSWDTTTGANENTSAWVQTEGDDDYGIIGFTNYGGAATFRVCDGGTDGLGWVNVSDSVLYGQSNHWDIVYTGDGFDYYINGNLATSFADADASDLNINAVLLEAYNFNGHDPNLPGEVGPDYSVFYSATGPVPEPGTLGLAGMGIVGLLVAARRRRKTAA